MSNGQTFFSSWTTDLLPTKTVLSSINPTYSSALIATISSAAKQIATEEDRISLYSLSKVIRGAEASLTIISAENYLATATETSYLPLATQAIFNSTLNLKDLEWEENLYSMYLNRAANLIFTIAFILTFVSHTGLLLWSKYYYFGICFFCGTALEFSGYLARALAYNDLTDVNKFLCQIICLTIAPAFIMAGIYYLLAQLIVIHGRQYSILKPMWFSYLFIFCDVVSLVIQAIGGGMAAVSVQNYESTESGTNIMLAGIVFQVFSMSLFLFFLFNFLNRIFFKADNNIRFSFSALLSILFNTSRGKRLRHDLEPYYNTGYSHIRSKSLYGWIPLIIIMSVIFIYVRCIYRVVELAEGWTGYLITHEVYLMTLDALMVFLACATYVPFHPSLLFGKDTRLSIKTITKQQDLQFETSDQKDKEKSAHSNMTNTNDDSSSII